jgi:hypothetical protein
MQRKINLDESKEILSMMAENQGQINHDQKISGWRSDRQATNPTSGTNKRTHILQVSANNVHEISLQPY